ncbi:DNA damage-inducible protein DinB [Patiriisocius marinistellae]|uniref:DNA damage-inducible protein DinB n=1 Tax=Patiriisocius marinistellae TaxID=2494560 RepID=A0A5J4FZA7_9FLAO|nr:DinB family protein [Patiriisocius marinistellae]GEQ86514.1 DNA damage-inducible protein DinB [Patiriisocius marinistellae]
MNISQLLSSDYLPYYKNYIFLNKEVSLLQLLADGMLETVAFFEKLPIDIHEYRYDQEKWTPKEILLHLIDTERVFAYRALTFARNPGEVLSGFDQDIYVANSYANDKEMDVLIKEYIANRTSTLLLFKGMSENVLKNKGIASGGDLSVAAAGFIICGHELHHCNVIKERYL